ncbi:MAG: hypothetical protein U0797_00070 [Gemmataceae bacterium]
MATREQVTVYVVQRLSWEYGDDFYYRRPEEDAPMKSFLSRERAERHRRDLEWEHVKAAGINPFGYVDAALEERTSLPMPQFLARLREAGMETGGDGEAARFDFWEQYDKLPDEGKRLVWLATDRVRFFELVEHRVDVEA